jgi:hypothetical protein
MQKFKWDNHKCEGCDCDILFTGIIFYGECPKCGKNYNLKDEVKKK